MRIDLSLKILQLCFLQMGLHKKLPLLHLSLLLYTFTLLFNMNAYAVQHLIKAPGYHANLILADNRQNWHIQISHGNLMRSTGKLGQRPDHGLHKQNDNGHAYCRHNENNHQCQPIQYIHRRKQELVIGGIHPEAQIIQLVNIRIDIFIKLQFFFIRSLVLLNISASLGLNSLAGLIQIAF